jgi:hypothetical protein
MRNSSMSRLFDATQLKRGYPSGYQAEMIRPAFFGFHLNYPGERNCTSTLLFMYNKVGNPTIKLGATTELVKGQGEGNESI